MAGTGVLTPSDCCWGSTLSLAVTLKNWNTESYFEEIKNLFGDRSWSGDHDSDSSTKELSELIEDQIIIECMIDMSWFL